MIFKRPIVLLASKTPSNIHYLIDVLNFEYDLKVAITPQIALKIALSNEPPDIILLDSDLSGLDELSELCHSVMENSKSVDNIPIVMISSEQSEQSKAFNMGATDFIIKPYEAVVLKAKVNTHARLSVRTKALERLASIDGLTGIANRRYFDDKFNEEYKRCARYKMPLSLVFVDIDYFKQYNDTYGHGAGDDCLRKTALCFKTTLQRPGDLVARYGGEEFIFLLPNTDYDGARHIANMLVANVKSLGIPHEKSLVDKNVTISAGVVSSDCMQENTQEALERADKALYLAKTSGRNRVC